MQQDVLCLRYTIDCPKVEMHPLDTCRLTLHYDQHESLDARYAFSSSIEVRALSRASRDMICLALKCYSAQTALMNSNTIEQVCLQTNGAVDLLVELEYVKRELYNCIGLNRKAEKEKQALQANIKNLEEEMQTTIQGWKQVMCIDGHGKQQQQDSAEFALQQLVWDNSDLKSQLKVAKQRLQESEASFADLQKSFEAQQRDRDRGSVPKSLHL